MNLMIQPKQFQPKWNLEVPERSKLLEIARLYASVFADKPWYEYKVCPQKHYYSQEQANLTSCTKCYQPLNLAYPEEERADYITKEISNPDGTLITVEDEGEIIAACWGYTCTMDELKLKYDSPEMEKKAIDSIQTAKKVQKIFYFSEIMVKIAMQGKGIGKQIAKCLFDKALTLDLNVVMRTRNDSPMVTIADKMSMTQIIQTGEDSDNLNRVLYIKL